MRVSLLAASQSPREVVCDGGVTTLCAGMQFHIRDALGRGVVSLVDTAAGPFLRLVTF